MTHATDTNKDISFRSRSHTHGLGVPPAEGGRPAPGRLEPRFASIVGEGAKSQEEVRQVRARAGRSDCLLDGPRLSALL